MKINTDIKAIQTNSSTHYRQPDWHKRSARRNSEAQSVNTRINQQLKKYTPNIAPPLPLRNLHSFPRYFTADATSLSILIFPLHQQKASRRKLQRKKKRTNIHRRTSSNKIYLCAFPPLTQLRRFSSMQTCTLREPKIDNKENVSAKPRVNDTPPWASSLPRINQ